MGRAQARGLRPDRQASMARPWSPGFPAIRRAAETSPSDAAIEQAWPIPQETVNASGRRAAGQPARLQDGVQTLRGRFVLRARRKKPGVRNTPADPSEPYPGPLFGRRNALDACQA